MSEISGGGSNEGAGGGDEMGNSSEANTSGETGAASEAGGASEAVISSESGGTAETGQIGEAKGSEIGFNTEQPSHGMKQTVETPATLEQAQASAEHFHSQSITQILDMNGKYISEADRERIEGGVNSIRAVEYSPNSGRSGAFHTMNGKSSIEVAVLSEAQMERTTKHETNHFASKNREIIVPMPDKGGYMVYQTVGMRHTSWFHNNTTGENSGFETQGRGLNEGMTTMYTNEQLSALSKEKGEAAEREAVYSHATDVCRQLQETMGKDALGDAYYGGKTMDLKEKMDAVGGKGTFEHFQSSMDKTISKDYAERVQGMKEAQEILAKLDEIKKGGKTS